MSTTGMFFAGEGRRDLDVSNLVLPLVVSSHHNPRAVQLQLGMSAWS